MAYTRFVVRGAVFCLALVLTGCSTYSLPGGEPAPVEKEPDYTTVTPPATMPQPPAKPGDPPSNKAWQPLVDKAGQASARGDYEQALGLLERAHRIDPDSGEIYLELAKTHRARGDDAQARATAERGMLYCSSSTQCEALRGYTH
jgi:Tetratricopeptide repeat